jgi:hypothetical protein
LLPVESECGLVEAGAVESSVQLVSARALVRHLALGSVIHPGRRPHIASRICRAVASFVATGGGGAKDDGCTFGGRRHVVVLQFEALITTARLSANPNDLASSLLLGDLFGLVVVWFVCGNRIQTTTRALCRYAYQNPQVIGASRNRVSRQ